MKCPIDTNTLVGRQVGPVNLDVCLHCQGVWFEFGELQQLVAAMENKAEIPDLGQWTRLQAQEAKSVKDFWQESVLRCPHDHANLKKHFFAGDTRIGIDTCESCFGFWFDGREIKALWDHVQPSQKPEAILAEATIDLNKNIPYDDVESLKTIPNIFGNPFLSIYNLVIIIFNTIAEELGGLAT